MDPLTVAPSEVITQPPQIDFQTKGVPPPSPLYLGQQDDLHLRVVAPTIAQGFQVVFAVRTLVPDGKVKNHTFPVLVNSSLVTLRRNLGECFLLSVTAQLGGAATAGRGQVFCVASIVRGIAGSETFFWTLVSDYITTNFRPTWPNSVLKSPLEGPGFMRSITGTDPAAGSQIVETVPARARWKLRALLAIFSTAAAVANRTVGVSIDDGAAQFFGAFGLTVQTATQAIQWLFSANGLNVATNNGLGTWAAPPDIMLMPGYRIQTTVNNMQGADDWFAPQYVVEEWADF